MARRAEPGSNGSRRSPKRRAAWGVGVLSAAVALIGMLDCVGWKAFEGRGEHRGPESEIDQASEYWESVGPETPGERPASAHTCLAFVAAQSHREALDACTLALEEDGGADIAEALAGTRKILTATKAHASEPSTSR